MEWRYQVQLLFEEDELLPGNFVLCKSRLVILLKPLKLKREVLKHCDNVIQISQNKELWNWWSKVSTIVWEKYITFLITKWFALPRTPQNNVHVLFMMPVPHQERTHQVLTTVRLSMFVPKQGENS